jgi:hypothetical protein
MYLTYEPDYTAYQPTGFPFKVSISWLKASCTVTGGASVTVKNNGGAGTPVSIIQLPRLPLSKSSINKISPEAVWARMGRRGRKSSMRAVDKRMSILINLRVLYSVYLWSQQLTHQ